MKNIRKEIEVILESDGTDNKHLYVMHFNGLTKIGKSASITMRICTVLSEYIYAGNMIIDENIIWKDFLDKIDFEILVFKNQGHKEKQLHSVLKGLNEPIKYKFGGYTECYADYILKYFSKYKHLRMTDLIYNNFDNISSTFESCCYQQEQKRNFSLLRFKGKHKKIDHVGYKMEELNKYINDKGKYKIGPFNFKTTVDITKFNRALLTKLNGIIEEQEYIDFAKELFKYHPTENRIDYILDNIIHIEADLNEYDKKYTVFVIYYFDKENMKIVKREFSSQKCITNIKRNL